MKKMILCIFLVSSISIADTEYNEYADLNRELILLPSSAALAGADLSMSSGASYGSSPANLPFNTANSLLLSYANYYQNTFSTSILSYSGPVGPRSGVGITAGYIYIPGIEDNSDSPINESGTVVVTNKIRNCSDLYLRFGYGYRFNLKSNWQFSAGAAVNARRSRLIDYSGYGLGLDAGARAYHQKTGTSFVLQMENALANYTYWSENYREYSYRHLRFGFGWEKNIPYIYGDIRFGYTSPDLLSNEGVNSYSSETDTNDQEIETPEQKKVYKNPELLFTDGRFGLEYMIMNRLAFRGGLSNGKINFGAGLLLFSNRAGLDFSYSIHQLAGIYQVSMMYRW